MEPKVYDLIQTVTFLLPVLALVWKGAQLTAELKQVRKDLDSAYNKACHNNQSTNDKLEEERRATDSAISTIIAQLSDIREKLARLDERLSTKMQHRSEKK